MSKHNYKRVTRQMRSDKELKRKAKMLTPEYRKSISGMPQVFREVIEVLPFINKPK